eukprot:jgi/Psemu1/21732/gm1.21732_g
MLTYSKYFQATASPFGNIPADRKDTYNIIYGHFAAADPAPQLLDHLLNLFEAQAAGALGIFVASTRVESRFRLVHGLQKYPGALTQASANKGKAFGHLDDIKGDAGELVHFPPDTMLAETPASQVLALVHHVAELDAQLVSAYKAFFIPFELPPRASRDVCSSAQNPHSSGYLPHHTCRRCHIHPAGPSFRSEPDFTMYMKNKVLYRDLPSLNRPPFPPGDPVLTAAATALTDHQLRLTLGAALWEARGSRPPSHLPSLGPDQVATCASELLIQAPLVTTVDTMISTEGNSLTLKDSLELHKTKAYIPVDWTKATTQLESYLAVLATILGGHHEVVQGY